MNIPMQQFRRQSFGLKLPSNQITAYLTHTHRLHANWHTHSEKQTHCRANGGSDRSALPAIVQNDGRRHGGVRNGVQQFVVVGLQENATARRP